MLLFINLASYRIPLSLTWIKKKILSENPGHKQNALSEKTVF